MKQDSAAVFTREMSRSSASLQDATSSQRVPGRPDPTVVLPAAPGPLVQDAFLAQARRAPDAPALVSEHGCWTFAQLERISGALAQLLIARGVGKGSVVAVFSDRNPALVACLLGVLRSRAAFQIVDAAYPLPRILACLRQTSPAMLLVAGTAPVPEELGALLGPQGATRQLRVPSRAADAWAALAAAGDDFALPAGEPSDRAYVSFTSGSTGTPKGIGTAHAPLPHFVSWHTAHGGLTATDRFSMLSGLSHDPLLRDVFTPLSLGASLHIPDQTTIFDADALWSWFAREEITVTHLTPAIGEILLTGAPDDGRLEKLRLAYWGGDVLRPTLAAQLGRVAPALSQTNFYGATETPQAMAFFDLAEHSGEGPIPIGRGIEGAQLLLLDEQDRLCEPGESGEIWIRSPYLAEGYLGDPEQTRARFVTNPFTGAPGDLCYRTGDRGRYLENGDVVFAGRADHQIKIRGFRVEPAEIVAALEQLPGVGRAVALAREYEGDKQLAAYVVCEPSARVSAAELRQALRSTLPSYMVPRWLTVLPSFPLLPNGKIDLQALPAPPDVVEARGHARPQNERARELTGQPSAQGALGERSTTVRESAETRDCTDGRDAGTRRMPRTDVERQLAALWAEILGLEEVSIDDSFLELGGDSLSAIRALSRMRRMGLSEQVARGIFQGRTIAELTGEPVKAPAARSLVGAAKTTLLINVLRGLLVATLVLDHWREGFLKRFPAILHGLTQLIEPIFDLPTPGFAFVFGMGLGHSQYESFLKNPKAVRRILRGGAALLAVGTLVMGLSRNLAVVARGLPLDYDLFCTNFFLPTLYYWMALASAPLWFSWLARREGRWGGSMLAALILVVACRGLYELSCWLLLEHEQKGLLQLGRLMLTARFSYFNLSTGALLGIFFGLYLRKERGRANLASHLAGVGVLLAGAGFLLHFAQRDVRPEGLSSDQLLLPKWLVYCGATLVLGALIEGLIAASRRRLPLRGVLEWLGVFGQCAMPIFILQGMALDVAAFGRALGLRDGLAVVIALGGFAAVIGWLMVRVHALYHGAIASDLQAQAAPLVASAAWRSRAGK